jgi:pilus assembly protein CpaB
LRRTSRLVLLAGIFLAALTFIVVIFLLQGNTNVPGGNGGVATPPPNRDVVVAAVDIPLGTVVTGDMLSVVSVPNAIAKQGVFLDKSQVIGSKTIAPITAGAQVTADYFPGGSAIVKPDPGPGKRAFAFSVNETTGVGNLVDVGDYVDVLISQNVTVVQKNPDGTVATVPGIGNALTVKMPLLLENLQVIGVIDQVAPPTEVQGQPAPSGPAAAPVLTGASKLLIVAVTPAQAEVLLFARTTGTLDVVYRSPNDTETVATDGVILKTLIDKYGVIPPTVIITTIP